MRRDTGARMRCSRRQALMALGAMGTTAACRDRGDGTVQLAAAASLTDVLPRALAGVRESIAYRFDASSRLARQIEAGAPTDVFVSADEAWMDELSHRGLVRDATRTTLLGNQLVVVVAASGALAFGALGELDSPRVRHLALAGESVPAGRYADAALHAAGLDGALASRIVRGESVRTALGWVASGDAEAGIVYATDARVEPRVRVACVVPPGSHPPIVYPAAVLRSSRHPEAAMSVLAALRGDAARAVFLAAGFTLPDAAR